MTNIALLGCTGSIGRSTLEVVRRYPDRFRVVALVCGSDAASLISQAEEFRPLLVGVSDESKAGELGALSYKCDRVAGKGAQAAAASLPEAEIVVAAVSGLAGLEGVIAAINAGKKVALANKETMVACGEYVTALAKRKHVPILPVDSEHSAVFRCLRGSNDGIKRIVLTASGGPFFSAGSLAELASVTPEQAVRHPNWNMGRKISVDSATMFNKGLEIIEARWLFGTENIDYIIQPDSIVHSMVELADGTVLAQVAPPDMQLPIQYALTYPETLPSQYGNFDFAKPIRFLEPKEDVFPMPAYARAAMRAGGTLPAAINAADEAAVALFLGGKIGFTDIIRLVEHTLNTAGARPYANYREVEQVHAEVYGRIMRDYKSMTR